MTSTIIPLVTPADRALAQDIADLLSSGVNWPSVDWVAARIAAYRLGVDLPEADPPAPPRKGRKPGGKDKTTGPYHWRRCE